MKSKLALSQVMRLAEGMQLGEAFTSLLEVLEEREHMLLERLFTEAYHLGGKEAQGKHAETVEVPVPPSGSSAPAGRGTSAAPEAPKPQGGEGGIRQSVALVLDRIKQGKIALPVLPQIAQKVLKLLEDQNITIKTLAKEITFDQSISSRLISLSNSAYYKGATETRNLQAAVAKIGLVEVRKHLYILATKEVFALEDSVFADLASRLSNHASAAGKCAYDIAASSGTGDAEEYLMMALLHDVGKLWLVRIVSDIVSGEEHGMTVEAAEQSIAQLFAVLHAKMGGVLLERWEFAAKFSHIVHNHHNAPNPEDRELCVVQFANQMAKRAGYTVETAFNEDLYRGLQEILRINDAMADRLLNSVAEFMENARI